MKIDHIGVAVTDLEESVPFYEQVLGLKKTGLETVPEQGVEIAFFRSGESKIELLAPLSEDSPIARHIEKRGEGLQHLALRVKDIENKVKEMREKGVQFLSDEPTLGAENMKIIFIHPRSSHGVLMELCQPLDEEEE